MIVKSSPLLKLKLNFSSQFEAKQEGDLDVVPSLSDSRDLGEREENLKKSTPEKKNSSSVEQI